MERTCAAGLITKRQDRSVLVRMVLQCVRTEKESKEKEGSEPESDKEVGDDTSAPDREADDSV